MPEEIDLSDDELATLERLSDRRREKKQREREQQFSIVDPPLRDDATSRAAKRKERLSEAATPLAVAIRDRLDALLKKTD